MDSPLEPIAAALKAARQRKGWSQRTLAQRVGLPQSHISKIENAAVDLQTTNLIQIARALDLEVTLIPRAALPAVQSLQDITPTKASASAFQTMRDQTRLLSAQASEGTQRYPKYKIFGDIARTARELERLPEQNLSYSIQQAVADLLEKLQTLTRRSRTQGLSPKDGDWHRRLAEKLRQLRRAIASSAISPPEPLPAYRLDDDEGSERNA
jgi:transcriptional regulator with XRE-family HTH domain